MNNTRIIFDDDFYRLGAILLSDKYATLEKEVLNRFKEIGYPLPPNGFTSYKDYQSWLRTIMSKVNKDDYPGNVVENLLSSFNVDPKNEKYRRGIAAKLFFNRQFGENFTPLQEPINLTTRNNGEQKELWVRIYPWTKKEDYINLWGDIKEIQPQLKGYRGKEKYQITFPRDFGMYQVYLKVKYKAITTESSLSIVENMTKNREYKKISKLYKGGYPEDYIRSITSRFNKLLAKINLL